MTTFQKGQHIYFIGIGGISMSGGKGRCLGILFGAMSYTVIDKIIVDHIDLKRLKSAVATAMKYG